MADKKPPEAAAAAPKAPEPSQEELAAGRIKGLEDDIAKIERQIKITEGKLANRNPEALAEVRASNVILDQRLRRLKHAFYALLNDSLKPRVPDDLNLQLETLRQAAIEFCQKANVDPEIWKNIAS